MVQVFDGEMIVDGPTLSMVHCIIGHYFLCDNSKDGMWVTFNVSLVFQTDSVMSSVLASVILRTQVSQELTSNPEALRSSSQRLALPEQIPTPSQPLAEQKRALALW